MPIVSATPHLPYPAQIEAYGNGGFRFGEMSHRGSIICLPTGVWAWPPIAVEEIDAASLSLLRESAAVLDFVIIGTGRELRPVPDALRAPFRAAQISFDVMATGAAVRTYNVMFAEARRVAAALIAVD